MSFHPFAGSSKGSVVNAVNQLAKEENRILLIMDGSRRHYDVAVALERMSSLDQMFADWYAVPWSIAYGIAKIVRLTNPKLGTRMLERYSPLVSKSKIRSNSWNAITTQLGARNFEVKEEYWRWSSAKTARWIKDVGFGSSNGLYGYVRNVDPELCSHARDRGLTVVSEQMIAPAAIEQSEQEMQYEKWPNWESPASKKGLELVRNIEQATWENSNRIVAPSQYVLDGLVKSGVSEDRIDLIPYPADFSSFEYVDRSHRTQRPTIGFVGQINLRKNAPVFLEVAKRLSKRIKFVMVGRNYLNESTVNQYRDHVEFAGAIPRSDVPLKLSQFDVFFFPSTCEGSAGVVLEAMKTGLPIVTTPNSGTIVRDNIEGFVCDPDEIEAFVDRIELLIQNPQMRTQMGLAASARASEWTLDKYGAALLGAFQTARNSSRLIKLQ